MAMAVNPVIAELALHMEIATDSAISQRKQWLVGPNWKMMRSPKTQENGLWPLTVAAPLREIVADLRYSFAQ